MTGILADIRGIMGTTLLGDGSVLLILDISELIG
jgi:two-component system chemotaxis sensor kinase CheA